jgi:hypothetical protein
VEQATRVRTTLGVNFVLANQTLSFDSTIPLYSHVEIDGSWFLDDPGSYGLAAAGQWYHGGDLASGPTSYTLGPITSAYELRGLPGQTIALRLGRLSIEASTFGGGLTVSQSASCVPDPARATFLRIPIVRPANGQPVGDEVTVKVFRADGTLLYQAKGFSSAGGFFVQRGISNAVHTVSGNATFRGPTGGDAHLELSSTAREGPAGYPELRTAPTTELTLGDLGANLSVSSGVHIVATGLIQVSAEDPRAMDVGGTTLGYAHPASGPFQAFLVPVLITWEIRDLT